MNEAYTFILLSTVGSSNSVFNREQRYNQTLETIQSIKQHARGSKIIFADNSIEPLTELEKSKITPDVDLYVDYENNLFSRFASASNDNAVKGINELLMMEKILPLAREQGLINKRVFKMLARYKLMPSFSLHEYETDQVTHRYVFKTTVWNFHRNGEVEYIKWLDTRLWSFCGSLYDDYRQLMPTVFKYMMDTKNNLELAHTNCINKELVLLKDQLHVEGLITNGEFPVA